MSRCSRVETKLSVQYNIQCQSFYFSISNFAVKYWLLTKPVIIIKFCCTLAPPPPNLFGAVMYCTDPDMQHSDTL